MSEKKPRHKKVNMFSLKRHTQKTESRFGQNTSMSKHVSHTSKSKNKNFIIEPATFLYLGHSGDPNPLQTDRNSVRSVSNKRPNEIRLKRNTREPASIDAQRQHQESTNFDNNSYAIIKKELSKSPKMANYIKEVYDADFYRT